MFVAGHVQKEPGIIMHVIGNCSHQSKVKAFFLNYYSRYKNYTLSRSLKNKRLGRPNIHRVSSGWDSNFYMGMQNG